MSLAGIWQRMLTVELVMAEGVTVLDRANIDAIMQEHQMTAEGLVKPENAKKLGEFAGVDAILTGRIAEMDNTASLIVKAISTETAEVVAAASVKFELTADMSRMLGLSVGENAAGANASASGTTAGSVEAIASKEFGSLVVHLNDVMTANKSGVPIIQCSIIFENRDLKQTVYIAANGQADGRSAYIGHNKYSWNTFEASGARGGLLDSSHVAWVAADAGAFGIAEVYAFEVIDGGRNNAQFSQTNPSAVVSYVRNGVHHDQTGIPKKSGKHWLGSFTSIPPGETRRVNFKFIPQPIRDFEGYDPRSTPEVEFPGFFRMDVELIVGQGPAGTEAEKVDNLSLRSLSFDRIHLPEKK